MSIDASAFQSQLSHRTHECTWLVTGAAGFIGSNIVAHLLKEGQAVVGVDNFATGCLANLNAVRNEVGKAAKHFTFKRGDVRDLSVCQGAVEGVDIVLHQAALGSVPRSLADPLTTHEVNVDGFLNMLTAARDAGVKRFVYASSSSVYGDHPGLPKVEHEIGNPLSPYAVTKRVDELYAKTFQDHYGLESIGLRYFNVFGRRQDPSGAYAAVIPKWIGQMLEGERPVVYGDGETSRDFCYVGNVVQANIRAALAPPATTNAVYNIAFGKRTTLNELYEEIVGNMVAVTNADLWPTPEYADFRAGDVRHSLADISAAKAALGYEPTHSVQQGLAEAIPWYVEQHQKGSAPAP